MDTASWVAIAAAAWLLTSIPVSLLVGRIISHADACAREQQADPVEVPADWLDQLVGH